MHVLCLRGIPVAVAERWETLSAHQAEYNAYEQAHMTITAVPQLED